MLDDDPTDFEGVSSGVWPVIPPGSSPPTLYKDPTSNAATGASAAGVRAFTAQAVAFYFRAPVKAFFRTRVDYLAYAKSISPALQSGMAGGVGFSWRTTTPGLLSHAIRRYGKLESMEKEVREVRQELMAIGWKFIPEQLAPPLAANVLVGAALYTSYLQILGRLHEPSGHATKTVFPPPSPIHTFTAGFAAGTIQSLIAAPLDALQVRFERRGERYENKTMWQYGKGKLSEIGVRGIFAGWGLSFLKDSFGSGIFFTTFEYVKAQVYYDFVTWYYGALAGGEVDVLARKRGTEGGGKGQSSMPVIKPHYALEPAFLMLAGMTASITQQGVLFPLSTIQTLHYERLEDLDKAIKLQTSQDPGRRRGRMLRAYYHAYQETWKQAKTQAQEVDLGGAGMRRWLYRGFWWFTIRQVPSTSAGLIIFELVRRKYGSVGGEMRINKDGYDILLT